MPLDGEQLSIKQALALCYVAGWRTGAGLDVAVAVMWAESGRWTKAYHVNDDGSIDRGLFQINDRAHPSVSDADAYDPKLNALYAWVLHRSNGWQPWAAYNSGAYKKFVPLVVAVRVLGVWRSRIKMWR